MKKLLCLIIIILLSISSAFSCFSEDALFSDDSDFWELLINSKSVSLPKEEIFKSSKEYLEKNQYLNAVVKEKILLLWGIIGVEDSVINDYFTGLTGKNGIMSYAFGIILMENGYVDSQMTYESAVETILSRQLENGSFAIVGKTPDVDATSMVVTALSRKYGKDEKITNCIERAIDFLKSAQTETGNFKEYGDENSESASQIIIALSSMGIDVNLDKFGKSVVDSLESFRLEDGTFEHIKGGEYSKIATIQATLAFLSINLQEIGEYTYNVKYVPVIEPTPEVTGTPEPTETPKPHETAITRHEPNLTNPPSDDVKPQVNVKMIISIIIGVLAVFFSIYYIIKKRPNYVIPVLTVAVSLILLLYLVKFESREDYFSETPGVGNLTATVILDTTEIENKIPLSCEISFNDGDSAYDVFVTFARQNNLLLDVRGSGKDVYIAGIGGIYEFQYGDNSGWIYFVNDVQIMKSCGYVKLNDGDVLEFKYQIK